MTTIRPVPRAQGPGPSPKSHEPPLSAEKRETPHPGWVRKLLWFIGLWVAGVATVALVAWLLRAVLV